MRVALYCRVSTTDQTCENQLRDLRDYCQARGWESPQEYVDHGVSGATDRRPALDALMAAVRGRKLDVVAVAAFDRFARSTRHLVTALDEMQHVDEFQYCIINNDLAEAQADLAAVVRACRVRLPVQKARTPDTFSFLVLED